MNKVTWLSRSPPKTAQKSIKQSRHTGAFPDHITPLCLPALQRHVITAPRPHCDINLPQNTGLINHLKGPMNQSRAKSETAAHFQRCDFISAKHWVDKHCNCATVGWTQTTAVEVECWFSFCHWKKMLGLPGKGCAADYNRQNKKKR